MGAKLTPHRISALHSALDRIQDLDLSALDITENVEDSAEQWGEKAREFLCVPRWPSRRLGKIIATAVLNEMMRERAEIVSEIGDEVECPPPLQNPDRENR